MHIDFLKNVFEQNIAKDAIVWNGDSYSYGWLSANIDKQSKLIASCQFKPGAVVALVGDFSPNSIALLLALIDQACIVVPLTNANNNIRFFDIAQVEVVFNVNDDDLVSVDFLSNNGDNHYYEEIRNRSHPGLVLFTSGTSGKPKAAVHDLLNLLEKFKVRRKALRTLNFLLFDHWGGLNTLFHAISNGAPVITPKERHPESICKLIEKHKIELLPTSPTFLNLMLLSGAHETYDLSSLQIVSYGSERMPVYTLKQLALAFPHTKLLQTYGLIELGVMRSNSESNNSLWVKIGGEGYETRVVDGLLQIKAKSAMLGYLNAPSPFTADGWFNTSDAVEVDGEYVKILGRTSEIINVGGEKVYPQEIEDVLLEMDNVAEATVYGEKNSIIGNIVCAKIRLVKDEPRKALANRVKKYCSTTLQKYKIPVKIKIENIAQHGSRFKKIRNIDNV